MEPFQRLFKQLLWKRLRFGAGAGDAAAAAHLMGVLIILGIILGFGAPDSANSIIPSISGIILGSDLEQQKKQGPGRGQGIPT